MGIDNIGGISAATFTSLLENTNKSADDSFASLLSEALGEVASTDRADKISNIEMLAGDGETLHGTLLEAEKADLALRMTIQVRNKIVDAYNEVMRMQV